MAKRSYSEAFLKLGFTELNEKMCSMSESSFSRINEEKQTLMPFRDESFKLYQQTC